MLPPPFGALITPVAGASSSPQLTKELTKAVDQRVTSQLPTERESEAHPRDALFSLAPEATHDRAVLEVET